MKLPMPTVCRMVIAAMTVLLVLSPILFHTNGGCDSSTALPTIQGAFCAVEHVNAPPMLLEGHDAVLPGPVKVILALIVALVCAATLRPQRCDTAVQSRMRMRDPWLPACRPFARSGYLPFLCAMRDP